MAITPQITPITPVTEHVPVTVDGRPLPPPDPKTDLARKLLQDALDYADATPKWPRNKIPGWRRLSGWLPNQWQDVINSLAQYLQSGHGGTFVGQGYANVDELLDAMDRGVIALG